MGFNDIKEIVISSHENVSLSFVILNLRHLTANVKFNLLFLLDSFTIYKIYLDDWPPRVFRVELSFDSVIVLLWLGKLESQPESAASLEPRLNADISSKLVCNRLGNV